ncbi:RNA-guided endonuclease InsQ/TnpB family protein [Actinomadura vinacea]|uniref:RNA-guided endonuclease InsQ/TnpB family protein n=1 Tax=Actinomadura vinacea TaxID=115336 RepID=UPI003CD0AD21
MPRYRLDPTPEQKMLLFGHCAHARFVWNLAVEQQGLWSRYRGRAPGFAEQCRQLTEARAAFGWLAAGSVTVQQQALRDFNQAMANFFAGTHKRPTWRKAGLHEGFRQVGLKSCQVRRLSRKWGAVQVPKVGWVRFRLSRPVPEGVKSYRVTRDRAERWHASVCVGRRTGGRCAGTPRSTGTDEPRTPTRPPLLRPRVGIPLLQLQGGGGGQRHPRSPRRPSPGTPRAPRSTMGPWVKIERFPSSWTAIRGTTTCSRSCSRRRIRGSSCWR